MTLAEELRETTDRVIRDKIEATNLQILDEMKELAMSGLCSTRYSRTKLSDEFIHYLVKEGFKLYGLRGDGVWLNFYPGENATIPKYDEIMIRW